MLTHTDYVYHVLHAKMRKKKGARVLTLRHFGFQHQILWPMTVILNGSQTLPDISGKITNFVVHCFSLS